MLMINHDKKKVELKKEKDEMIIQSIVSNHF